MMMMMISNHNRTKQSGGKKKTESKSTRHHFKNHSKHREEYSQGDGWSSLRFDWIWNHLGDTSQRLVSDRASRIAYNRERESKPTTQQA